MVKGLDVFREHFKGFEDRYVIIGGTASSIVMEEAGTNFRSTKDLDIVLCIESFDSDFAKIFWNFVKKGEYSNKQKSTGRKLFYRFHSPKNRNFPYMLELFSRIPNSLKFMDNDSRLIPVPVEEDIFRLFPLLPGNLSLSCPQEIKEDLKHFTDRIESDSGLNLKVFGIRTQSLEDVISTLKELYDI